MRVLILALAGAECGKSGPAVRAANEVTIVARDYTFDAPDTIPAGRTTLHLVNTGAELHHAVLVHLDSGRTMDDFLASLHQTLAGKGAPPAWVHFAGGPNAVFGADTASVTAVLTPGLYALICVIPTPEGTPHLAKGMARALVVRPAREALLTEPEADGAITLEDFAFRLTTPLTSGRHTIRVENTGAQWHEMQLAQLAPGKTIADLKAWEAGGAKGPPPIARWIGGVAALAPGDHQFWEVNLEGGSYVLICFLPDVRDGEPHLMEGMVQEITVH